MLRRPGACLDYGARRRGQRHVVFAGSTVLFASERRVRPERSNLEPAIGDVQRHVHAVGAALRRIREPLDQHVGPALQRRHVRRVLHARRRRVSPERVPVDERRLLLRHGELPLRVDAPRVQEERALHEDRRSVVPVLVQTREDRSGERRPVPNLEHRHLERGSLPAVALGAATLDRTAASEHESPAG